MNILVLSEGDPETRRAWSGISKSVVDELRRVDHRVFTADCDLTRFSRLMVAALSFSPKSGRWRSRFRLGGWGFRARSRKARAAIASANPGLDLILQTGATFEPRGRAGTPYVVYCDSNIRMAERGRSSGHSQAVPLSVDELREVVEREADVYRDASAIFTISEQLRQSFVEDFAIPPSKVHTVFAGPNMDVSQIPESAGRTSHPPRIVFVGRQFERKGGDVLIAAFEQVRRQIPDCELWIVGPEAGSIPAKDGLRQLGFVNSETPSGQRVLRNAYLEADVFCLPTRFEPFGVAYLEAMHHGLPCIGTDAWAVPEIITDGETGFTVPVDDADTLAERLVRLLTEPELAATMGAAGRRRARTHFTWTAVVERMVERMEAVVMEGQ